MHVPSPKSSNACLVLERIGISLRIHRMRAMQAERHGQQGAANCAVCSVDPAGGRYRLSVYFGDEFSDRFLILSAHIRELDALPSLFCPDHCRLPPGTNRKRATGTTVAPYP